MVIVNKGIPVILQYMFSLLYFLNGDTPLSKIKKSTNSNIIPIIAFNYYSLFLYTYNLRYIHYILILSSLEYRFFCLYIQLYTDLLSLEILIYYI